MLTITAALAAVLVMAAPAHAAITRPVAIWQMNETSGSVMVDSGPNHLNGAIGSHVQVGVALGGWPGGIEPARHPPPFLRRR